jgi:serine phosphatase RsbU (regulator of sigma subunit)
MARARFTLRAYLVDGDSPEVALAKSSRQFDITNDGHIITAVVGVGNWRTGELTIANAGHPMPLLLGAGDPQFLSIPVGPPLGTGVSTYGSAQFAMPEGSTLLLYTDGLIERRAEAIDEGMSRLVDVASPLVAQTPTTLVSGVVSSMRDHDADDDVAVLALRRVMS